MEQSKPGSTISLIVEVELAIETSMLKFLNLQSGETADEVWVRIRA